MDRIESVGCQNCIALKKKLELFELLKQKCCKTDDITKNFLALKTSYEKTAKVLENKSKKLSEARSKLKDAAKAEEVFRRKAAEFQLRLVSSDNRYQDILKDLDSEREKNAILLQEKCRFENLVESKENEIVSLNLISKQCEEKFSNDIDSLNDKMEKKIDGLKSEILKLQELNIKLKAQGNHKKRLDKLREDLVDIFKDGLVLAGEPLKRFKKLFNRLQENETAAKLEAILDTPSMTPDGTTSSDTGVFSGDEDFGCPSLGNDLEMSSDSDEDFESVESHSNEAGSVPSGSKLTHSKMSKANSRPKENRFPTMEPDTEFIQDMSGSNISNDSVNDGDNTLCAISGDSVSNDSNMDFNLPAVAAAAESKEHLDAQNTVGTSENSMFSVKTEGLLNIVGCDLNVKKQTSLTSPLSSPSRPSPKPTLEKSPSTTNKPVANVSHAGMTVSLFSPPKGDFSPSYKSQDENGSYEISFDVASSASSDKCHSLHKKCNSDTELPNSSVMSEILKSKSDSKLKDISISSSAEKLTNTVNSLSVLEILEESKTPLSEQKNGGSDIAKDLCRGSVVPSACSTPAAVCVSGSGHNFIEAVKRNSGALSNGKSLVGEDTCSSTHDDVAKSCSANIQDLGNDSIKNTTSQDAEMDLDIMLHEWNPPTPVLPFSDDSCGFDGTSSSNLLQDLPQKFSLTVSVGTNTDMTHCVSTASSPVSHLFMKNSSTSTDEGFKHERIFKDAYSSPPRLSSCSRASSPMKIRCKNIGLMPIAELSRNVAISPLKVMKNSSATSPLRSVCRDVSTSPIQVQKLDCGTNPPDFDVSASNGNKEESWTREAKMLHQTLEVLGICTGDLSGGVLDQSLVDELRKAMEMALKKTSKTDISRRKPVPSKQFNTSYCSFDPCEFAEICNQQHYNLHLLAKAKNVEKTMCSREKRRRRKLKRLNSTRRQRSLSALSFKEEILEDDDSSQKEKKKKKFNNLFENSSSVKEMTDTNSSKRNIIDSEESFNIRPAISPKIWVAKSVPHPEGGNNSKLIEQMNNGKSQVTAKILINTSKSVLPEVIHLKESVNDKFCDSSEDLNASASCMPKNANNAPDLDHNATERTSSEVGENSSDLVTSKETKDKSQCEPCLNDSDSSDATLIIDDSIPSMDPILPEEPECNDSTKEPCKPHVQSSVPDANHFVLPKPLSMSLRKRRQSSSSESSTADNSPGDAPALRRSPRTKKIRIAHDGYSNILQRNIYQKGYTNFVKGETSIHSEVGRSSEKTKPSDESSSSIVSDAVSKLSAFRYQPPVVKSLEEHPMSSILSVPENVESANSNTILSDKPLKRRAENKSAEEESFKRTKPPSNARPVQNSSSVVHKVPITSEVVDNGLEDSDTDMECDEKINAGTANTKPTTTRKSSIARKPSKLQKMRSSVSKVHPMVQGTKTTRSPRTALVQDSVDECIENPVVSKPESTINPKLVEDSKDEASIIERLRGRGNVRMAAAASGRTAQLIQVKPGARKHQRPAATNSPADCITTKAVPRVARTQPLVCPADRVSALGRNIPSKPTGTQNPTDSIPSTSTDSTSASPGLSLLIGDSQSSAALDNHELKREKCPKEETEVSVHLKNEIYESSLIPNDDLRISTFSPLVCALTEVENAQPPTWNKKELIRTKNLVASTLKEFIAAPSFTSSVLQKALDALSDPNLYNISPVIVQNIVKMMDDDFDTAPMRLATKQSFAPPLTPAQQQLVTLIVQLSSQHQHLQQLPHQVLRLLEYRVFRLGVTPEGDRLVWCSKLYAAICRIYCLRSQALIFCWDSLYALRGRSYFVVKAVMDVWPHLFPINPSFEKACPNAQVLLHLLRSFVENKNGAHQNKFDDDWLKRLLRSRALQSLSINSSILASTIFANLTGGGADTNVAALVLLAKREDENWAMRNIVSMKLLPTLNNWRNGFLNNVAGERVIWVLCSILRAIPPERNGNTSVSLMKLLTSELLRPETTLAPQMQEVITLGLTLLSRHDVENVAVALASWNPKYGPSRGFSSRLLQYLTSVINSGARTVSWWQNIAVNFSKSHPKE